MPIRRPAFAPRRRMGGPGWGFVDGRSRRGERAPPQRHDHVTVRKVGWRSTSYRVLMVVNIKDPDADRLIRELAALTGESLTDATRHAVQERLDRLRRRPGRDTDLRAIIARGRARATRDTRSEDEILGFGPHGLPT